jgi:hypothetical protein
MPWGSYHVVWPSPWCRNSPVAAVDQVAQQALPVVVTLDRTKIEPQDRSPLFRLLPEIRARIFDLALQTYCGTDAPYAREIKAWRPDRTGPLTADTALLQTCRAVYVETWSRPVLQTSLIIHDGYSNDLPKPRAGHVKTRQGKQLFYFQAWQLLLLQHIEVTMHQWKLMQGDLGEWLRRVDEAKRTAANIVRRLADEADAHSFGDVARKFVDEVLLGRRVRSLSLRINRQDWHMPDLRTNEDKARAVLRLQPFMSPFWVPKTVDDDSDEVIDLVTDNFKLTLVLETYEPRLPQLLHVVEEAKKWTFDASRRIPDEAKTKRVTVRNGRVTKITWQRRANKMSQANTSLTPDETIETRTKRMMVWDGQLFEQSWQLRTKENSPWLHGILEKDGCEKVEVRAITFETRAV